MSENNNENEILLWNSFKDGNAESFVLIFKNYYSALYHYGCKITLDTTLVEDVIQDLFVDLWRSGGKAELVSLKAYLFTAFKFKLLKAFKDAGKINIVEANENENSFEISRELILINGEHHEELHKKVAIAMKELTARQSEIIYLKFYQNLSYEEVSEIMHISYQASRNLLYQSIKVLKKIISLLIFLFSLTRIFYANV